ncbi:MAG: tripartite tricarboxylate transporter TctB family protein [Candidatus Anstonellales archaeon]
MINENGKGPDPKSLTHDLFMVFLGGFAGFLLATFPIHVDTKSSFPFYKGPVIFPLSVLFIIFISALPSFYRLMKPPPDAKWFIDGEGWPRRPAVVLTLIAIFFLIGISVLGVEISVFLFLFISIFFLGYRNVWINFILPFTYTILIILIFKYVFGVYFPKPLIFQILKG